MKAHLNLTFQYLSDAVHSPSSWIGAVIALILQAVTPTPQLGAAVFAMIALCMVDIVMALALVRQRAKIDPTNPEYRITSARMGQGFWKIIAYLVAPATMALMKLAFPAGPLWDWASLALVGVFSAREVLSIAESCAGLGAPWAQAVMDRIHGLKDQLDGDSGDGLK